MTARAERVPGTPDAAVLALYRKGATYKAIIAETGVSHGAITRIVREAGVPLRLQYQPRGKERATWEQAHGSMRLTRRCPVCLASGKGPRCPQGHLFGDMPAPTAGTATAPGRANWRGAERACVACGDPFRSFHAKHVYCLPCGQARTDALDQARYRRMKGNPS